MTKLKIHDKKKSHDKILLVMTVLLSRDKWRDRVVESVAQRGANMAALLQGKLQAELPSVCE